MSEGSLQYVYYLNYDINNLVKMKTSNFPNLLVIIEIKIFQYSKLFFIGRYNSINFIIEILSVSMAKTQKYKKRE